MTGTALTYLDLVKANDNFPSGASAKASYYALYLPGDPSPHGYLLSSTVALMPWTPDFRVVHTEPRSVTVLDGSQGKETATAVNQAFYNLISTCIDGKLFHVLDGKHSELVAIVGANHPIRLERFASSLFGITNRGAHLIAYTRASGGMRLWIPRRSPHLYTAPGKLDSTVAGGVKAGASPLRTIVDEAGEEASLPRAYVEEHVRARGIVTTVSLTGKDYPGEQGLVLPNIDYVYDMELVEGMMPRPQDDEVDNFQCLTVPQVQEALLSGQFKTSSAAIMVDFLIRHGVITNENESDYIEIIQHLHRQLPFRMKSE